MIRVRTAAAPSALLACVAAALLLGACAQGSSTGADGSSATGTPAPSSTADVPAVDTVAPNGESVDVQALDNSYRPATLTIAAGTEVVFTNVGRNDHNVIPADGSTDWGVATEAFRPKDVYRHVFGRPGTYTYYCSIHGTATAGMLGTIIVTD